MINLDNIIGSNDKILIVPNAMKSYFLEYRILNPKTNFKLFSIDEIFKNIVGNYYSKEAIKFGLNYFNKYTYSSIKEINEVVFKTFRIHKANDELKKYESALRENKLKVFDEDFALLLKSREIMVIGLSESSTLKSLFEYLEIKDVTYLEAEEVIEVNLEKLYWKFKNINEEVVSGLNAILYDIEQTNAPERIRVCLDVNRYEYYIDTYMNGINVPYQIDTKNKLIDSKTFKYIYKYIKEDINIVEFLKEHKNDLINDACYEDILSILEYYEVDKFANKKINITEILKSQKQADYEYTNDLIFSNSLSFSLIDSIHVFGFDQSFIPSSIKDTGLISFKTRETLGLDSFNETNIMNVKLEEAFIKQANINHIFYHEKDNNGRNNESYFVKFLNLIPLSNDFLINDGYEDGENKFVAKFYSKNLIKINYRKELDEIEKTGESSDEAKYYFKYFDEKILPVYSNSFKKFNDFKLDDVFYFSYSNIDTYNKCPFEFYCQNILKIDEFEETIYTKFGNIAHAILEKIYENCFVFDEIAKKEIEKFENKNGKLTKKELALLPRFLEEVKRTCDLILEHKKYSSISKTYSEKRFDIVVSRKDSEYVIINDELKKIEKETDVNFTGRIDRIIKTSDDSLFLIDYKTGRANFSQTSFLNYGENSQLPAYITLLDHCNDQDFKDKVVAGLFIQPLIVKNGSFYNFMNPKDEDIESAKLQGRFLDDYDRLFKFDNTLSSEDSKFVAGLKANKGKNQLSKQSKKTMTNEDITKFRIHFEEMLAKISSEVEKAHFDIYPIQVRTGSRNNACSYCNFRDICFAKYEVEDFNE